MTTSEKLSWWEDIKERVEFLSSIALSIAIDLAFLLLQRVFVVSYRWGSTKFPVEESTVLPSPHIFEFLFEWGTLAIVFVYVVYDVLKIIKKVRWHLKTVHA